MSHYRRDGSAKRWQFQARRGKPLGESETEVLDLLADGFQSVEISAKLCVAPETVTRRCAIARAKLGAQTVTQAVVKYALMKRGKT